MKKLALLLIITISACSSIPSDFCSDKKRYIGTDEHMTVLICEDGRIVEL